jgi:hypothetical protein
MVSCYRTKDENTPEIFYSKAHDIISHFLIAINVATLGLFTWDFKFVSPAPYQYVDVKKNKAHFLFVGTQKYVFEEELLQIQKPLIWRTLQLLIVFGTEKDRPLTTEYIKGLYNFHNGFFDINFINESFSNFYKAFEFFCTKRILKVNKLKNEKKQLRFVLSEFGFKENALKDFDKIYLKRCNLAMHAQKGLQPIDKGAVLRIKIFLDSIMHKYYRPVWEKILKK